jgi:4-amino-4-deoxy-L-arabinose transferase-like glycosyltransferase
MLRPQKMNPTPAEVYSSNKARRLLIGLVIVALVGVALRVYPSSSFQKIGYDEALYRQYVSELTRTGISAYPAFAEHYVELQKSLPAAVLPPTRFLYIFTAYLWHQVTGATALVSLHNVSCAFSILLLLLATGFAWRLGGLRIALCVTALMSCAPTQIHMAQHALIDGFFAFWATLSLWFVWENLRRPNNWLWLTCYTFSLVLLVLTKENAMFVYVALVALLAANRWLKFGQITRALVLLTFVGPLIGVAVLVNLCGSLETIFQVYLLLVSKASVLPYAIATGDGPWYRYLVDLMLMSPVVLVLAIGGAFVLKSIDKAALFLFIFVVASYLLMANVRYGMNLRYATIWDLPFRYLAVLCLTNVGGSFGKRASWWLALSITAVSAIELRQYVIFFVDHDLYELVTGGLLRAVNILK